MAELEGLDGPHLVAVAVVGLEADVGIGLERLRQQEDAVGVQLGAALVVSATSRERKMGCTSPATRVTTGSEATGWP